VERELMNTRCVLTGVGTDRPGLVEEVSEFIFLRGGSIETSRMVNLSGCFAIAILIAGTEATPGSLESDLHLLHSSTGIQAQMTVVDSDAGGTEATTPYRFTGRALDQPGLVHEIANALRDLNVSIESVETSTEPAPVTGTPTFSMALVIAAPRDLAPSRLRQDLERTCDALNIDGTLTQSVVGSDESGR
jgi:glycine cleavage system transcriptional repressor